MSRMKRMKRMKHNADAAVDRNPVLKAIQMS